MEERAREILYEAFLTMDDPKVLEKMSYKKAKAILIREFGQWGGLPIGNIDCSISGEDVDGTTTGDSRTTILSQLSNSEFRALFYPVIMEVAEECIPAKNMPLCYRTI